MDGEYRKNFDRYLDLENPNVGSVIHDIWITKDDQLWSEDPYFYVQLGTVADKLGQSMFSHDILEEGLKAFPKHLRLTQLFALSQIKCGFLGKARGLLTGLVKKGHDDEETLGILGRVYKDMWQLSSDGDPDHRFLRQSRNLYLKAFIKNRGYYSGINAASLSLIMGKRENAEKLARAVVKICVEASKDSEKRDYWILATLGEANIILGRFDEADRWYRVGKSLISKNYSDLASTKRQLKLLSRYMDIEKKIIDGMKIPTIVAFTGHLIDAPGRKVPRFPESAANEVSGKIQAALEELDAGIGYSSAGCGSDILFLEGMQKRRGECNVVLPFDSDDFFEISVDFAGEHWSKRAQEALQRSPQIIEATQGRYAGDDTLFSYANRIIMGRAILRSRILETEPVLLAVWNGAKAKAIGGAAEFINSWKKTGLPVRIIDIGYLKSSKSPSVSVQQPQRPRRTQSEFPPIPRSFKRDTKVLLFADLVGYSKLKEEQFPWFVHGFLKTLANRQKRSTFKPIFKNIWGDALYFVFEDTVAAAEYALDLRDTVRETDWAAVNLPKNLNMRIGLHAGPVFFGKEPVLNKVNFFGHHVNQAARIEPITNPGNVYASEQFAALLMAEKVDHLDCRYVGVVVLPKEFGSFPIYHIKRKTEIE